MNHIRLKLVIAAFALLGSMTYLAFSGVQKGWVYYLQVDEFLSQPEHRDQRVRLCGRVAEEGLVARPAELVATFVLKGVTGHVPVAYRGVIPDLFKADCEVVVEGKLDAAGIFQADVMLTKCASKYSGDHAERTGAQP